MVVRAASSTMKLVQHLHKTPLPRPQGPVSSKHSAWALVHSAQELIRLLPLRHSLVHGRQVHPLISTPFLLLFHPLPQTQVHYLLRPYRTHIPRLNIRRQGLLVHSHTPLMQRDQVRMTPLPTFLIVPALYRLRFLCRPRISMVLPRIIRLVQSDDRLWQLLPKQLHVDASFRALVPQI